MTDASAQGSGGTLTPDTTVVVVRGQASAALPGETIILGMEDGVYYGVAAVGQRVWSLLAAPTTLGEVHRTIVREFDVAEEVAWRDLIAFVGELRAARLVDVVAPPA